MLFERFKDVTIARRIAADAFELMTVLYPICRSITGNGARRTLDLVERWIPLLVPASHLSYWTARRRRLRRPTC